MARELNVRITLEDLSQLEDKKELNPSDKELEQAFTMAILDMDLSNHYSCKVQVETVKQTNRNR